MTQRIGSNRIANTAVIGLKLADNSVRGNNIVAGQITGNLIGTGAITGNLIGTGAITGNLIGTSAISSNHISDLAVTGNEIGLSAISANNLASNLHISLTQVLETGNVYSVAVGGNVNIDLENNTLYFFSSNTTANVTFNFRANTQNTLDSQLPIGSTITSAILLKQGATRYRANVYVDGTLQTPWWLGNSAPSFATSQQESIDVYSFSILKTAANAYTVLASNANFQRASNQNP
jgi:hypothetical protein